MAQTRKFPSFNTPDHPYPREKSRRVSVPSPRNIVTPRGRSRSGACPGIGKWGDNCSPTTASFVRLGQHDFAAAGVHRYAKPGAYTVVIIINGSGGASAQKTTKVTVPPN